MSSGSTSQSVLAATSLTRSFGRRQAVAGIDLDLAAGDTLALFGPNGAGKTTLLRLLAGLLRPTSGTARILGEDARGATAARGRVGLISHHGMLYAALSAFENVRFAACLYGVADPARAARAALDAMQAGEHADVPIRALSRGLQQRVSIARAIVHAPAVLLLDEPYAGLDAAGAAALTVLLRALAERGATLVMVTHNVGEGLDVATHAAIMDRGRFVRLDRRAAPFDATAYAAEYREMVGHVG